MSDYGICSACHHHGPLKRTTTGRKCWPCIAEEPPAILCSSCGEPLKRNLAAFECRPCGRSVTA